MGQIIDPNSLLVRTDKQPATVQFLNNLINQLCLAMNGIGVRMDGYDSAVSNLVALGLANINSTLGPFLTTLQEAASLGFLVGQADGMLNSLTVGVRFDMALTNQGAALFTPTKWLTVMDVNDSTNWGVCQLVNWVPTNANLATMCIYATKPGQQSASWQVACGSGVVTASVGAMTSANSAATSASNSASAAAASAASVAGLAAAISAGPVVSVAGRSGAITLAEADIAGLVADLAARPLASSVTSQIAGKQNTSATLTALAALTYSSFILSFLGAANAPGALSTLGFSSFVQTLVSLVDAPTFRTSLGAASLVSPVFTGTPQAPTATIGDNSTNLATTAFVTAAIPSSITLPTAASSAIIAAGTDNTHFATALGIAANYVTITNAASNYLTISSFNSNNSSIASTYLTQANAASTYVTSINAAAIYATKNMVPNNQSGNSYTLQLSDNGGLVVLTSLGAGVNLTCPNNLPANFNCAITQEGPGTVIISAASGATLASRGARVQLNGQYAMGFLRVASNSGGTNAAWRLAGDIV